MKIKKGILWLNLTLKKKKKKKWCTGGRGT